MDTRLRLLRRLAAAVCLLSLLGASQRVNAQTFTTLHSFSGSEGALPGVLIPGNDGNLYGTTAETANTAGNPITTSGTLYRISTAGVFGFDLDFTGLGANVNNLTVGSNGFLFGTLDQGGSLGDGSIFELNTNPVGLELPVQLNGTDGERTSPAPLVIGPNGNFYGTTFEGGANAAGVLYEISQSLSPSSISVVHTFSLNVEGTDPNGVVVGSDGNLYGTTLGGTFGANQGGTIYRIAPDGSNFTILHAFTGQDGLEPTGALFQGADGNFYGTTQAGGTNDQGTVFNINPTTGVLTTLHSFTGPDGAEPQGGVIQLADGNFYGTTVRGGGPVVNGTFAQGDGSVFKMTPAGVVTVLHQFVGPDGLAPRTRLAVPGDGNLYGTTFMGGALNLGTVFKIGGVNSAAFAGKTNTNQAYFTEDDLTLTTPAAITALTVTITVQRTPGLTFSGMYQTVNGQFTETHVTNANTIVYTYVLQTGATVPAGGPYTFAAQMGSTGTTHNVSGDTWTATYTSGGLTFSSNGVI